MPFSLVIITKNEEKNIERCIRSVPNPADVVVVDSGSEDRTVEIARRLGARVNIEPWRGFAKQKIRATALARYDWVLSLDADEALSDEARAEITALFPEGAMSAESVGGVESAGAMGAESAGGAESAKGTVDAEAPMPTPDQDAYAFPRLNFYMGRWMRHSGMYPDYQTRFFHRQKAKWLDVPVHEKIEAQKVKKLSGQIRHWSFENMAQQIQTINRYSSLRSEDFRAKGRKFRLYMLCLKPFGKFIEVYFFKKGFLDGMQGLIVAFVSAFATFLRWAKLYEIETSQKS